MNDTLPIKTLDKIIRLRNTLDKISQISWSFSVLNKSHPVQTLTVEDADELTAAYERLIGEAKVLLN